MLDEETGSLKHKSKISIQKHFHWYITIEADIESNNELHLDAITIITIFGCPRRIQNHNLLMSLLKMVTYCNYFKHCKRCSRQCYQKRRYHYQSWSYHCQIDDEWQNPVGFAKSWFQLNISLWRPRSLSTRASSWIQCLPIPRPWFKNSNTISSIKNRNSTCSSKNEATEVDVTKLEDKSSMTKPSMMDPGMNLLDQL